MITMLLLLIDLTEFIEMQSELNDFVERGERINKDSEARIDKFKKLGLSPEMRKQILNVLFGDE